MNQSCTRRHPHRRLYTHPNPKPQQGFSGKTDELARLTAVTAPNVRRNDAICDGVGFKSRREHEMFTEYRAVDRAEYWRYSGGRLKRVF